MGLDIFFLEDIRNALLAANETSAATAEVAAAGGEMATLRAYREGYKAALITVAIAFGLSPNILSMPAQKQTEPYEIKSPPEWVLAYKEMNDEQTG